jgi:hypothetical protein
MAEAGEGGLQNVAEPAASSSNGFIDLPTGKPLREDGASNLLRQTSAPIVLLAGAAKSGKTTLLASLHDSFQRNAFAGYFSAGSQTLIGFEERCFDSRVASGAEHPSTVRTRPAEGLLFYHMRLRKDDLKTPIKNVLIADMSGEHYSAALDSGAELRALTIIRRADHFVHLIDGGKLVSRDSRALIESTSMMLMRRCFQEQMFDTDAKVDILLTKWDIAIAHGGEEAANAVLGEQREAFNATFGNRLGRIRIMPIAARPSHKSPLAPAYGLSDLFRSWVDEAPRQLEPHVRLLTRTPINRGFDTFALHESPELFARN